MVAPLEAPHTLPSASHLRPLPFYKQSAPVSPLFASLAKSAHRVHSTPLSRPLFSTTCALFCTNENAMSFAFNRLRTLCAKHGGCGCSVCVFSSIFSASSRGWVSAISCGMNTYEKTGEGGGSLFLCGPDDRQLLCDVSEVRIAGDQRGFAKQGQGGREAIDVRKLGWL